MKKISTRIRKSLIVLLVIALLTLTSNAYTYYVDSNAHQFVIPTSTYPGYGGSSVGLKCHLTVDLYSVSAKGEYDWYYLNPSNVALCNLLIIQTTVKAIAEFQDDLPQTKTVHSNFTGQDLPRNTSTASLQTDPLVLRGKSMITTKLIDVSTANVIVNDLETHTKTP